MSFKFKHLEKIVGVFLTLVIITIIGVIMLIGKEQRWFEKHYEFTTKFSRGEGLSPGMQVQIKGIQVGEVTSVFLNKDNWIEVRFRVFEDYAERIRQDSVVRLRAPLIGSKALEIIPGDMDKPVLANGSYIWSADTEEGEKILKAKEKLEKTDEITRILQNVEKLTYNLSAQEGSLQKALTKMNKLFAMLSDEKGSLNQTLKSIEYITKSIENREGSIGKILNDNYELYDNINDLLTSLNKVVDDFQKMSRTLAETSPELKAAIERSNATMDEAIGLIKTLKKNFFIRGFSSRKETRPAPVENTERAGGYESELP